MITVGIRQAKNNLSQLLAQVKKGEEILITDRGKPIARIVKENQEDYAIRKAVEDLVQAGLVILPSRSVTRNPVPEAKVPGRPVSEMVTEDRR